MRGALIGAIVMAAFGGVWGLWGAGALSSGPAIALGVLSVVLAAGLVLAAVRRLRTEPPGGDNLATTTSYWVIVAGEGIAIGVGNAALGISDHSTYIVVWTALVVGVHFLVFGQRFIRIFTPIGAAIVVVAAAGLVLGLAGAGDDTVVAVTALGTAAVLLAAAANAVRWVSAQRA